MLKPLAALEVLAQHRGSRVVVATMGAVGQWPALSDTDRDFCYMPSSMGQGIPFALGLALQQPHIGAIVLTGDGSLLMNLGCLVTVAAYPAPLAIVLLDNGLYEVTGGQPVVGVGRVDYANLAKAAGIEHVYTFTSAAEWLTGAVGALNHPEPAFIWLRVAGTTGQRTPSPPRPMAEQIARLRRGLATSSTRPATL
jgi:thiamine pyrophosphate-dependent acetolactate synthase large subunit-like protein